VEPQQAHDWNRLSAIQHDQHVIDCRLLGLSHVPVVLSQDPGSAAVIAVASPTSEILAMPSPVSRMLLVFRSLPSTASRQ
jgi:hypothetical protein